MPLSSYSLFMQSLGKNTWLIRQYFGNSLRNVALSNWKQSIQMNMNALSLFVASWLSACSNINSVICPCSTRVQASLPFAWFIDGVCHIYVCPILRVCLTCCIANFHFQALHMWMHQFETKYTVMRMTGISNVCKKSLLQLQAFAWYASVSQWSV